MQRNSDGTTFWGIVTDQNGNATDKYQVDVLILSKTCHQHEEYPTRCFLEILPLNRPLDHIILPWDQHFLVWFQGSLIVVQYFLYIVCRSSSMDAFAESLQVHLISYPCLKINILD
jgi:hypothetical protein